jgi:hypothetical protein
MTREMKKTENSNENMTTVQADVKKMRYKYNYYNCGDHLLVFYLKHNLTATGRSLRLEVETTQLVPREVSPIYWISSSQTYKSYRCKQIEQTSAKQTTLLPILPT